MARISRRRFGALTLGTSALTLFGGMGIARAQQFITILTGGTSGVYYPLGVALSQVFSKSMPNAKVTVQSTKASVENLNLLQAGRGELAFSLSDSYSQAVKGDKEAGFNQPLSKLRHLASIYPNFIQIVASKDSGIKTLADLKGKRISVGAPKSGTELNARAVLNAAGITYDDFEKVEYLPFAESVDLMKNRQLDVTLQSAGLGVAALRDLSNAIEVTFVPVPEDVVKKINDAAYVADSIPANTYTGQTEAVPAAAVPNALVTHSGVPDDVAYEMTKGLFENLEQLSNAHAAAKQIKPSAESAKGPAQLHPGAERYYKEKGLL